MMINRIGFNNNYFKANNQISMRGGSENSSNGFMSKESVVQDEYNYYVEQGYDPVMAYEKAMTFDSIMKSQENR